MIRRLWLKRLSVLGGAAIVAAVCVPSRAEAQIVQVSRSDARNLVGFNLGYFALRGEDARTADDVLLQNAADLTLEIGDFNNATVGGEWLYGVSDFIEAGVGLGYYRKSVPTVYRDFRNADGTEVAQRLKLRVIPITATVRFLPLGRGATVEPYVGAGIGIFNWRYTESGEFIDFDDLSIFRPVEPYKASGNAIGPVILGGLRAPIGDMWTIGGEIRWQRAEGDTDRLETGLIADTIDLGGWHRLRKEIFNRCTLAPGASAGECR